MRKSSRLLVDKRSPSGTINQSSEATLQKEPNAPSGTTGLGKAEPSRAQPSKKKLTAGTQNESAIRQQILETNKLRQALNNLGITTKAALQTAVKAKSKRVANISKATVDHARLLNNEVDKMREDINEVLKDLENALMLLTSGTSPLVSFDLESSKTAFGQINARYVDFKNTNNTPSPIPVQGQEGKPKEVRGGKNRSGASTEDPSAMQLDDVGGDGTPNGQEIGGEPGPVVKPQVLRTARAKQSGRTATKVGSKRSRSSGDEANSSHKKPKKVVNDLDESMSDLTSSDESDHPSKNNKETSSVLPPANSSNAPTGLQETQPQVIPRSVPQPATGLPPAGEDVEATLTQGKEDGVETANKSAVDHPVTRGSTTPNPVGDHDGTPSPPTDPPAANKATDKITSKTIEQVTSSPDNGAAHELLDRPAEKTGEQLVENTADEPDDHAVNSAADQMGEVTDETMDTGDEVATNLVVDEADDEMTDAVLEETPDRVNKAAEMTDDEESSSEESSDGEDDTSDPKDVSVGPDETSAARKKHGVPAAHHDKMRLAATTDVDELFKHIANEKASAKKEASEDIEVPLTKEKAKTAQRVTLRMKWDALDEDEQKKWQDDAITQVRLFLRDPTEYRVPVKTRAMIREIAEFCIPACQTTRQLALHILENKYKNVFCIFHQKLDKGGKVHDRSGGTFGVTGTPFARLANKKAKKSPSTRNRIKRPSGYFHCGCIEDEALLEFYWWKVAEATSPVTKDREGWLDHRKMDPRTRTLMFRLFTTWTHMEVDDIYVGYPLKAKFDAKMARYDTKIAQLQDAKAQERKEEARRVEREEANRIEEEEQAAAAAEKRARKKEKRNKRRHAM